jgi:hypothetical protein
MVSIVLIAISATVGVFLSRLTLDLIFRLAAYTRAFVR